MYCSQCGTRNEDHAQHCVNCSAPLSRPVPPPIPGASGQIVRQEVPNYLIYAILSTVFCCLPFGIVSIIYAAQVNGKLEAGDIDGALSSSANAKRWAWISFGAGLAFTIIYFGLTLGGFVNFDAVKP